MNEIYLVIISLLVFSILIFLPLYGLHQCGVILTFNGIEYNDKYGTCDSQTTPNPRGKKIKVPNESL